MTSQGEQDEASDRSSKVQTPMTPPGLVISELLSQLKPSRILTQAAWIPRFRQTCFVDETVEGDEPRDTSSAPSPVTWQEHVSSAPPAAFSDSFATLLAGRPQLVYFGEQHHQPHVIRAQIQLMAALADHRDALQSEASAPATTSSSSRTTYHLHLLLEHFSMADQPLLDRFHAGTLSISELCSAYRQRSNEGFQIEMYAPLLLLAREKGARIWGGFPERQWARKTMKEGIAAVKQLESSRSSSLEAEPTKVQPEPQQDAAQPHPVPRPPSPLAPLDITQRSSIPLFSNWDQVSTMAASHRSFLSSLMRPEGSPYFPRLSSLAGCIGPLSPYRVDLSSKPEAAEKGFRPAQALKDSYLAHAARRLVEGGHLLNPETAESAKDRTTDDHKNIVMVVAGLGHIEAGFGAPERVDSDEKEPYKSLIVLSKPNDSPLWLGPEWIGLPQMSKPATLQAEEATSSVNPEWAAKQLLQPHDGQVAGHPGSLQSLRGPSEEHLIVKQSLPVEVGFYEQLCQREPLPRESPASLASRRALQSWTAPYFGALKPSDARPSIITSDLLAGFSKPNVLDVKLGTQLWDDDSSAEKRLRMEEASRSTTSGEWGLRLTGWRTWNEASQDYTLVPKALGKSITGEQLPLGLKAFFGLLPPRSKEARDFQQILQSCDATLISPSKPEARAAAEISASLPPSNVAIDLETKESSLSSTSDAGRQRLALPLLSNYFLPQLSSLLADVSPVEFRMRGGSLLVVYEGDHDALKQKMLNPTRQDESILNLHLIDFAHARFTPGQGPDEGVVKGLKSLKGLVEGILEEEEVKATRTRRAQGVDLGWDRKLADAIVLYDWVDTDQSPSGSPSRSVEGEGEKKEKD